MRRKLSEKRRVTEIAISRRSDVMNPAIAYNGKAFSQSALSLLVEKIAAGTDMAAGEVKKEMQRRERFLSSSKKPQDFEKSFSSIQKAFFGSEN